MVLKPGLISYFHICLIHPERLLSRDVPSLRCPAVAMEVCVVCVGWKTGVCVCVCKCSSVLFFFLFVFKPSWRWHFSMHGTTVFLSVQFFSCSVFFHGSTPVMPVCVWVRACVPPLFVKSRRIISRRSGCAD